MPITPDAPDDPFAALNQPAQNVTQPVADTEHSSLTDRAPVSGHPQPAPSKRSGRGCVGAVIIAVVAIGVGLVGFVGWIVSTVEVEIPSITTPQAGGGGSGSDGRGVAGGKAQIGDGGSLFKRANLVAAVRRMRDAAPGTTRMGFLRVSDEYLVGDLIGDGTVHAVYAHRDGRVIATSTRPATANDRGVRLGRVDLAAPDRIRRGIARIAKVPASGVDYALLWNAAGQSQWLAYLKPEHERGRGLSPFRARLDGRRVKASGSGA